MAAINAKKFEGLPDLDLGQEIYETPVPDLTTDDGTTVQTDTLDSEPFTPSDEIEKENLVRTRLDREAARRRFEPTIVNARDTNLSDTIGGLRRGYRTGPRRRRRRRAREGHIDYDDEYSIGGSSDEEESLASKLARLKREAEEVRLELERREKEEEDAEFEDSVEHPDKTDDDEGHGNFAGGMAELDAVLKSLNVSAQQSRAETAEQELKRRLNAEQTSTTSEARNNVSNGTNNQQPAPESQSTVTAIAAFAERLTALETALGVSQISPTSSTQTSSILPTLAALTNQISTLSTTLVPPSQRPVVSSSAPLGSQSNINLDALTGRLKALQLDADSLVRSRKEALQILGQLHEKRNRNSRSQTSSYAKIISLREARKRDSLATDGTADDSRPPSRHQTGTGEKDSALASPATEEERFISEVFLEEQANKITALYNTLPTIQNLQPLLPTVLDRLRALNVVHASAGTAYEDMEKLEARLGNWEEEIAKWSSAVESVEKGMEENKEVMKENIDVVGDMVKGVEVRLDVLEKRQGSR